LEDVWDLEDQFTALAGSASGVQASVSPVPADNAQGGKTRVQEAARGAGNPQRAVTPSEKPTAAKAQKGIYIEKRPQGDNAVRRSGSARVSAIEPTQAKAIEQPREIAPDSAIHVERVRDTPARGTDKRRNR
jgi:hypothetical protein